MGSLRPLSEQLRTPPLIKACAVAIQLQMTSARQVELGCPTRQNARLQIKLAAVSSTCSAPSLAWPIIRWWFRRSSSHSQQPAKASQMMNRKRPFP